MSFDKLEDKILRTKYDIEQEFKDLKFIHQHEIQDNTQTIYHQTYANGSFKNSFVVSYSDDLYINFKHELFIPKNLSDFWTFYEKYKNTHNIILDSRIISYIAYACLKYEDDIMVYDVYGRNCITIYQFASNFFNVQATEITINIIKQLFVGYLVWNTATVIKQIKLNNNKNTDMKSLNIFDTLINCARVKASTSISSRNIYYIVNLFQKYFSEDAFEINTAPANIDSEWKLNQIQDYEFLVALTVLKNNDFHVKYIE